MKTKRRHELHTNYLADWLGTQIEAVRPYTQYIVAGVIAVLAVIAFGMYQVGSAREQRAAAWRDYYGAVSERRPEALESVALNYPNSPARLWALLSAADIYLEEGARLIYTDRATATDTLKKAHDHFETVANNASQGDLLWGRAHLGLAQTYEALTGSGLEELELAKKQYAQLAEAQPDSVVGQLASRRLKRLDSPELVQVFKQLAGDIIDPELEYNDLPERPDLSFPGDETALNDWEAARADITPDAEASADTEVSANAEASGDDAKGADAEGAVQLQAATAEEQASKDDTASKDTASKDTASKDTASAGKASAGKDAREQPSVEKSPAAKAPSAEETSAEQPTVDGGTADGAQAGSAPKESDGGRPSQDGADLPDPESAGDR